MMHESVLMDFNLLLNYDYAVIKVVLDKFNDPEKIRNTLNDLELEDIYSILENRVEKNPLHIIVKTAYESSVDDILEELYTNNYDDIISNLIVNNNIYNIAEGCNKNKMVSLTICCKNEMEQQIIKELFGYSTILISDVDYKQFDAFMIHHNDRLLSDIDKFDGKSVYLAMTRYNLLYNKSEDKLILPPNVLIKVIDRINLKLIGLFLNTKGDIQNANIK